MPVAPTGVELDVAGGTTHAIQQWGFLNNLPILTIGATVDQHGQHSQNAMSEGSLWFLINMIPVCKTGNKAACGDALVASQIWFLIS